MSKVLAVQVVVLALTILFFVGVLLVFDYEYAVDNPRLIFIGVGDVVYKGGAFLSTLNATVHADGMVKIFTTTTLCGVEEYAFGRYEVDSYGMPYIAGFDWYEYLTCPISFSDVKVVRGSISLTIPTGQIFSTDPNITFHNATFNIVVTSMDGEQLGDWSKTYNLFI